MSDPAGEKRTSYCREAPVLGLIVYADTFVAPVVCDVEEISCCRCVRRSRKKNRKNYAEDYWLSYVEPPNDLLLGRLFELP